MQIGLDWLVIHSWNNENQLNTFITSDMPARCSTSTISRVRHNYIRSSPCLLSLSHHVSTSIPRWRNLSQVTTKNSATQSRDTLAQTLRPSSQRPQYATTQGVSSQAPPQTLQGECTTTGRGGDLRPATLASGGPPAIP